MPNSAARCHVAKIKVRRDKFGQKFCKIELARLVDERDKDTPAVAHAIAHMQANPKVTKMALGTEIRGVNLIFYGAPTSKPSETCQEVQAWNFRLKRDHEDVVLSFDFDIPIELARRWLIGTIGDEILCVIEDAQMSFSAGA